VIYHSSPLHTDITHASHIDAYFVEYECFFGRKLAATSNTQASTTTLSIAIIMTDEFVDTFKGYWFAGSMGQASMIRNTQIISMND
jgi:hypothetical protein